MSVNKTASFYCNSPRLLNVKLTYIEFCNRALFSHLLSFQITLNPIVWQVLWLKVILSKIAAVLYALITN